MSGLGWTALGAGGLAVALSIVCVALALRLAGLKDVINTLSGSRAELKFQVAQLEADRALAVGQLADLRGRYERQIADLRGDIEQLRARHLRGASDAEIRDAFDLVLGRKS